MQLTNVTNVASTATAAIASATIVVPLAVTALALLLVAVCSIALPAARRRYALLVLDRLVAFAAAVRGGPAMHRGGPEP